MPQISIVSGIYTNDIADYRQSYPVNYYPSVLQTGVSTAYLRPTPGAVEFATGNGAARGEVTLNGIHYRVTGASLVRVYSNGLTEEIGSIPGAGRVSIAKSFDRICIVADGQGFYWTEGGGLQQITDPNFTRAIDVIFIDGYFLFIDEQNIFNSSLSDPAVFDPLSFGSAEADGDQNVAIVKVRGEAYVCGQFTTEVFSNVGGSGFPFQRVPGAMVTKGVVGTHAAIEVEDAIIFVGSGEDENASVYASSGGAAQKIATDSIEKVLQEYSVAQLSDVHVESYEDGGSYFVLIHLPDQTLVYDLAGSKAAGAPLWHVRKTNNGTYRLRGFSRVYGKWLVGDVLTSAIGELRNDYPTTYGVDDLREFTVPMAFVDGNSFVVHRAALYGLSGRTANSTNPKVSLSISRNGITWGQERWVESGKRGQFDFTPEWRQLGRMHSQMTMRFKVANGSFYTPARLQVDAEVIGG